MRALLNLFVGIFCFSVFIIDASTGHAVMATMNFAFAAINFSLFYFLNREKFLNKEKDNTNFEDKKFDDYFKK